MVQVGKELQRSSGPTPCSRRPTENRSLRTVSRQFLDIFKYGDFATSLVKLYMWHVWSPSQWNCTSWCSDRPPVFQFVKEDIKGWQLIAVSTYISTNYNHPFSASSKEVAPEGTATDSHNFGMSCWELEISTGKVIALTAIELTCLCEFRHRSSSCQNAEY